MSDRSQRIATDSCATHRPLRAETIARRTASGTNAKSVVPPRAWPVRDDVLPVHDIILQCGSRVATHDVHYRLEGTLSPDRDNVVLIVHALTGTVRATEWWRGVVAAGAAIDPTRHAVLTATLLGGCGENIIPHGDAAQTLPSITTRDQAAVLARLLDGLGISMPLLVCGGSLGGQVTLEFAASFPDRVRAAVVLAAPATQTAQGLAWNAIMRRAIAVGGVHDGLALARMVGMLSYRTPEGLERRFGRARSARGTFLMNDWLDAHGEKLVARFDAARYGALLDTMDAHDVGRHRGGISAALGAVANRLTGVGIPGDLLYPAASVREWTQAANARYVDLLSIHGHDAFLLETRQVNAILRDAIDRAMPAPDVIARLSSTASREIRVRDLSAPRHDAVRARSTDRGASLRIALAGSGHVGGGLLDLLAERNTTPNAVRVKRVLVSDSTRSRPALARAIASGLVAANACVSDASTLLDDTTDVLVEAIGGTTTARTLVETALRRGIRVVTANKALLAERGPELLALAHAHGTRLDFEGAVAGAIPVVRCIRSGAAGVGITQCSGILNGTSNFVLDRVADGCSLSEAIRDAQRLGYAAADPSRDLSGEDAEDKLRVLAWLMFGVSPRSLAVVRRGIDAETASWAAQVAKEGDRVKVIASCTMIDGTLISRIAPTRVTCHDPWASVHGPANRIVIESASAGALVFHGAGAGGRATAGAVLGDLLA